MRFDSSLGLAALALLSTSACDVFNDELEAHLDLFALSDTCSTNLPKVLSSEEQEPMMIGVSGLTSNVSEIGNCEVASQVLAGADGFFQIKVSKGQRWHFHLDPAKDQNLAIFAARDCDLRGCVAAADVCGAGESEHFTFVAEEEGDYKVVLDGIDPSAGKPLSLLAISPVCGDKKKVHGEVCDDGNLDNGDGCDNACRVELAGDRVDETEPNDDIFLANVVRSNLSAPVLVNGKIGGPVCQPDYYLIRVPAAGLLDLTLQDGAGDACVGAPAIKLELLETDPSELRVRAVVDAKAGTGGACPQLLEQPVDPGTYFVRVSRLEVVPDPFEYRLELKPTPLAASEITP